MGVTFSACFCQLLLKLIAPLARGTMLHDAKRYFKVLLSTFHCLSYSCQIKTGHGVSIANRSWSVDALHVPSLKCLLLAACILFTHCPRPVSGVNIYSTIPATYQRSEVSSRRGNPAQAPREQCTSCPRRTNKEKKMVGR